MTDTPPPDPNSSRLGFDDLIGIVVAFGVIGIILWFSLRQRAGEFSLEGVLPPLTTPQASPNILGSPAPDEGADTLVTEPEAIAPTTPTSPVTPLAPDPVVGTSLAPTTTTSPTPVPTVRFTDVPQDYWALPFIAALSARGIIAGFEDGTFRPNAPVTRAEFAAQLNQAFGQGATGAPGATEYSDVPDNFWAAPAIGTMTQNGFLSGYPGQVFRPQQQIPKFQALLALNSGLNLAEVANPEQVLQAYEDAEEIPDYATNAIAAATDARIVVNYPERQSLEPDKITTRAEAAALIYQSLVQAGQTEAIASEYIVQP